MQRWLLAVLAVLAFLTNQRGAEACQKCYVWGQQYRQAAQQARANGNLQNGAYAASAQAQEQLAAHYMDLYNACQAGQANMCGAAVGNGGLGRAGGGAVSGRPATLADRTNTLLSALGSQSGAQVHHTGLFPVDPQNRPGVQRVFHDGLPAG